MSKVFPTAKCYVLDTNVLLHDAESLTKFQENTVVLPSEVLVEMDRKKTAEGQVGVNARKVHRFLRDLFDNCDLDVCGKDKDVMEAEMDSGGRLRFVITDPKKLKDTDREFLDAVLVDRSQSDHRILTCAYYLSKTENSRVIMVTKDGNMALKGKLLGLSVEDYRNDRIVSVETSAYREILVDGETFENLQNYQWDEPEEEGFDITLPEDSYINEYFIVKTDEEGCESMLEPVRKIDQDKVTLLPLYRQHLRQDVTKGDKNGLQMPGGVRVIPRNIEQWMHMDAVVNPDISLVTCIGKAGTGKTFVAMAVAMHELLSEHNHYEKL